ncbi:DUF1937 family protein [Shinella zoogloeoides]|uniref:DUF1937 family protein n=1 Tax=Shinella zoogloeoides TaxID=352475 RepID=UPI001F5719ED|nr:DUF1937 family protein [Shinella zoogloeoides]
MAIPESQKPYNELATTTFGPLEKYRPANDNVPATHVAAGMSVDSAGNMRPMLPQPEFDRGIYVGLRRPPSTDSGHFHGDNPHMEMTPEDRLPPGLALMAATNGYIYLGSPYSKYEAGHDAAARVVADAAASLMRRGLVIYSPIAHGHAVAAHGLPLEWDFWKAQCQPLIDGASGLIVLTMDGWQESVGLQYEIEEFVRTGRPILHVSPAWLVASEVGRVAA